MTASPLTEPSSAGPTDVRAHEPDVDPATIASYILCLADDSLIAAQRLSGWIATAPQLEEDVALANIALDLLGQARSLLTYAGSLLEPVRSEDDLAFLRDEREFRNVHLVERSYGENGRDFAVTIARHLYLSTYQHLLYTELARSSDETIAAIAAKAVKEVDYHCDHAGMWVLRLGDGTAESSRRMQAALEAEWPYTAELFDGSFVAPALLEAAVAVDPGTLQQAWTVEVGSLVERATLRMPTDRAAVTGGRRGVHTEQMGFVVAEMQHLVRSHPGASW